MKWICLILIVLATAASGYLLHRHFLLADLTSQPGTDFCSALFGRGCDEALQSPLAVQLGLPLAGWGLVYYATLLSLLLLGWTLGSAFRAEAMAAGLVLAVAAALGSVALLAVMVTGLSPFCPLCATVHVVNLLLPVPLKRMTGRSVRQLAGAVWGGIRYLVGGTPADPAAARWKVVGFLVPALVAVVVYQWVYVEVATRSRMAGGPFDPREAIALFESSPRQEIPVSEADPRLGPADAGVRMIVFSDFQCPGCWRLALTMPRLAKQFQHDLQIVFKHYPLDSACNPNVKKPFHPRACEVARAAEAAREQGKFWAFHDDLFRPASGGKRTLKSMAEQLGLDVGRFDAERRGEQALARIRADIDLGARLGVDGTPAVFLDGRRVRDTRPEALQFLIAHEVEHSSRPRPVQH